MTDETEPPEPEFTCWTCEDYGFYYIYHPSTDGITGTRRCPDINDPVKHPPFPPCGVCEACRWVEENGAVDEATDRLSRPACTGPPPNVIVVPPRHLSGCDGTCNFGYPDGCPPF